jgi:hypothetical protein
MTTRAEYFQKKQPDKCRWRTAKTAKRCWECNGEIRELDTYLDSGVVVIDKFITAKFCVPCAKADVPR